jgi:hypothetical protein
MVRCCVHACLGQHLTEASLLQARASLSCRCSHTMKVRSVVQPFAVLQLCCALYAIVRCCVHDPPGQHLTEASLLQAT